MRPEQDELWKEVLERLFPHFIKLFHPILFHDIIWDEKPEFLDKEFNTLKIESSEGKRYIDKLVQVKVRPGQKRWILIHIEIQGYKDKTFPLRMFTYFYRIYDRYKKEITTLVIFTDPYTDYKPDTFSYNVYGTELLFKYNTYKIIEYDDDNLKRDENIFSLVVLAAKYAIYAKDDEEKKVRFTKELIRLMYKKGKTKDDIINLFKFISGVLYVTDPMKKQIIREEIDRIEEVEKVAYISYIEEDARKEGLQEGLQQGLQEGIKLALEIKFGEEGLAFYNRYISKIRSIERLEDLKEKIKDAERIEELM